MEDKFNYSEQKHSVHVTRHGYTNTNEQEHTTDTAESEVFYSPHQRVPAASDVNRHSSAPRSLTDNECRCILHDLAEQYQKLVRNIAWNLPRKSLKSPRGRTDAESCPVLSQLCKSTKVQSGWRFEEQGCSQLDDNYKYMIGFVEFFRQRMYYERLGIPLTSLELLYLCDTEQDCRRQRRMCQDRCTQTDNELLDYTLHRLRGGNVSKCGLAEGTLSSEVYEQRNTTAVGEPSNLNLQLATASSQYFEALSRQASISEEQSRNAKPQQAEPADHSCGDRESETPMPAATTAASLRVLMSPATATPPTPLPTSRLAQRKSRDFLKLRKKRRHLIMDQGTKALQNQSSLRFTYQSLLKFWGKGRDRDRDRDREFNDTVRLIHLLRHSSKNFNLPGKAAAQQMLFDDIDKSSSCKVEMLLAPDTPRLLLNEMRRSGLLMAKSITFTETSSLLQLDCASSILATARLSFEAGGMRHGSADTLNEVWCNPGVFLNSRPPAAPHTSGERKRQLPIDALIVGCVGAPILGEQAARAALEKCAFLSREFDKLSREQRAKDVALRLQQLRLFQAKASRDYISLMRAHESRDCQRHSSGKAIPRLFECPLNKPSCVPLLSESMLAHFLHMHLSEPGLSLNELYERDQVLIMFQPRSFRRSRNVCLSMIAFAFAGAKSKSADPPVSPYMPVYNVGLPDIYSEYAGHLPLFVMACRTRLRRRGRTANRRDLGRDSSNPAFSTPGRQGAGECVMALWLVSVELTRPVHVQMTVFNRRVDISRSSIMQVRGLNKCHDCDKFMLKSQNYLRLTGQDLRVLTNNYTEPIYLELSVQDYARPSVRDRH
ncbi:uncharacterized protein LOC111593013 [Drosophila hydei]|uniref:Uncharacterized protein LOC111593013 n=1 Tax=Drosophila hydei TaxID=7224 RepID=A0A6J1L8G9_DROHY|nr:uncharacterized protein LOC111593013 [Drosophila hydei]